MVFRISLICFLIMTAVTGWCQRADSAKSTIELLSFNILHGATTKGDFNLDVIADVIRASDPDFVALQEVDFKTQRAKNMDLATELGWRSGMAALFGKAMKYDGGEYGEGILSRHTFLTSRTVPLPYSPGNEPRAALEVVAVLPSGDTIAVVGTHLDHLGNPIDRIAQAKKLNEIFAQNRYPTILMGDLNATPESEPIQILREVWTASYRSNEEVQPTYPSSNPTKKIDYIMYLPKDRWKVLRSKSICDSVASDHCAYYVALELLQE